MLASMSRTIRKFEFLLTCAAFSLVTVLAQPLGEPDRSLPGDEMIQSYLKHETEKITRHLVDDLQSQQAWESRRGQFLEEYFYMLGLPPRPEKSPLRATITRTLAMDDYVV